MEKKSEAIQIPAGYVTSGGLMTSPIWIGDIVNYLQVFGVVIGVLIGLTTLYLNYLKIMRIKKEKKDEI